MGVSQVRAILEKEMKLLAFTHMDQSFLNSVLGPGKGFAIQSSLTRKKALTGYRASPGIRLSQAFEPH